MQVAPYDTTSKRHCGLSFKKTKTKKSLHKTALCRSSTLHDIEYTNLLTEQIYTNEFAYYI